MKGLSSLQSEDFSPGQWVLDITKIDLANFDSLCNPDGFHVFFLNFHFVRSEYGRGGSFCSDRVSQGWFVSTKWRSRLH